MKIAPHMNSYVGQVGGADGLEDIVVNTFAEFDDCIF
jgi:hypothetical protein